MIYLERSIDSLEADKSPTAEGQMLFHLWNVS